MATPNTGADLRQNKKLTNVQVFKLYGWVEADFKNFRASDSYAGIAVIATTTLGFEVNENHIRGAFEQLGISLPKPPATGDVKLAILKSAIEYLYRREEIPLPADWNLL
jgi:hypothetical protein